MLQNNIYQCDFSSSALSKYCPLYPGILARTYSSIPSSSKSFSLCHSISTNISTQTSSNQSIQNHQPPSLSTNSNSHRSQKFIESYTYSSPSLTPSLKSLELNIPEKKMICLTTNPTDEDTTLNPKWKIIIPKLYHHVKSSIKV